MILPSQRRIDNECYTDPYAYHFDRSAGCIFSRFVQHEEEMIMPRKASGEFDQSKYQNDWNEQSVLSKDTTKKKNNEPIFEHIIASIVEYAADAFEEVKTDRSDFNQGKELAYYEVLSTIHTNMLIWDIDPEKYGIPHEIKW